MFGGIWSFMALTVHPAWWIGVVGVGVGVAGWVVADRRYEARLEQLRGHPDA